MNTSSAYIIGNTISDNGAVGVGVTRVSYAEIASNTIDGNGGNGINVAGNSGVLLGADTGGGIRNQPNSTTANNGGFGIRCDLGGYADGRLGTLNGVAGPADFADSCIYSLIP